MTKKITPENTIRIGPQTAGPDAEIENHLALANRPRPKPEHKTLHVNAATYHRLQAIKADLKVGQGQFVSISTVIEMALQEGFPWVYGENDG